MKMIFVPHESHCTLTGKRGDPTLLLGTQGQKGPPGDLGLPGNFFLIKEKKSWTWETFCKLC